VHVIGRERMLAYEGRFEKRGVTLYDYAVELGGGNGAGNPAPIVPITRFAGHPLEVPAAVEPLALAAAHLVETSSPAASRSPAAPAHSGRRSAGGGRACCHRSGRRT
jgi:hypothetical protein